MKEFVLKHPWMTFFIADMAVYNVCTVINNAMILFTARKGEKSDESSGDTQ